MKSYLLSACLILSACAHGKIPRTEIEDTPENRAVYTAVQAFVEAFEAKDAAAVLALVSKNYYEDNGNVDASDDYDFEALRTNLSEEFEKTDKLQLMLTLESIDVEDEEAHAFVKYTVRANADFPAGTKWLGDSDRSRIRFLREGVDWKIVGGL